MMEVGVDPMYHLEGWARGEGIDRPVETTDVGEGLHTMSFRYNIFIYKSLFVCRGMRVGKDDD
jgi:hypothetical protein